MKIIISEKKLNYLIENLNYEDTVYHGGTVKFKNFDLAYVNSGAKAQDYGYGIYLAKDYDVALTYSADGYIYTAEIPPINGKYYINLNKKINSKTVNKIFLALYKILCNTDYKGSEMELRNELFNITIYDGGDLYGTLGSYLGSDKYSSEFLNSLGYKGLIYDIGSNHECYVMFNPKDIKIVKVENPSKFMSRYNITNVNNDNEFYKFEQYLDKDFLNKISFEAYYKLKYLYTYDILYKKDIKEKQDEYSIIIAVFDKKGKLLNTYDKNGNDLKLTKSSLVKLTNLKLKDLWYDKISANISNIKTIDNLSTFKYIVNITNTNQYNIMDFDRNFYLNNWYDYIEKLKQIDLVLLKDGEKYNIADFDGNILFDKWLDEIDVLKNKFMIIMRNHKYNLADFDGNILFDKWFKKIRRNIRFSKSMPNYDENILCYATIGKKEVPIGYDGKIIK